MKKKELWILILIAAGALIALVVLNRNTPAESSGTKVAIQHGNTIVQEFDPNVDAIYTVDGDTGGLQVEVKDGKVYIGRDAVLDVAGVADQKVTIGIRPEGFNLDDNGSLCCKLSNVEVMGRDVSIVSTNEASLNPVIRSIINADNKVDSEQETVRFSVKPHKLFLFNKETEERLRFEVK